MRDFHKIMIENQASVSYSQDTMTIQLKSCSFKSLKDIVDMLYIEFGLKSDDIRIFSENGMICLEILLKQQESEEEEKTESEEVEEKESQTEIMDNYNSKILTTAIELVRENGPMSPSELVSALVRKGIVTNPTALGRLLSQCALLEKRGHKWRLAEDNDRVIEPTEETEEEEDGWKRITEKGYYRVDGDDVVIGFKGANGKIIGFKRVPLQILKEIYDELPEISTTGELTDAMLRRGVSASGFGPFYLRIMADLFGGDVLKKASELTLIKKGLK